MKSAIIWNSIDEIRYAIVDEDWTRFQGIYVNDARQDWAELCDEVYDLEGDHKALKFVSIQEFQEAVRLGAVVVECGFIP